MKRRELCRLAGVSMAALSLPPLILAKDAEQGSPKVVWVMLRGALDPLHTLVPTFDPDLSKLRPTLYKAIKQDVLALSNGYALHPSLVNLHAWYQAKELLPVAAVSSGYPSRSHFDGQDFLEAGLGRIDHESGWLGRAVQAKNKRALAIARATPISLRSDATVNTWYPSRLQDASTATYESLLKLYEQDEQLSTLLQDGLDLQEQANSMQTTQRQGRFIDLVRSCASLMVGPQGNDCAMLELGGWDTHKGQANRLARSLKELDKGLAVLKEGLGGEWQNTVVVVGTEFGRTAKENGTGGTDHGTASALFFAGGAINGGRVLGQWPGLSESALFQKRDLRPTSNVYSWLAAVLGEHWQMSQLELAQVFPSASTLANSASLRLVSRSGLSSSKPMT